MHPDDLELFEYVEGDLDEGRRPGVAAHVAVCERCAEEVRLLEAGKQALRESPLLALPPKTKDALLRGLPRQAERERVRLSLSPRRLVAVLAPVAVVAVAVTVVLSTTGNGEEERAAAPAEPAAAQALKSAEEEVGGVASEAAPVPEPAGDAAAPSLGATAPLRAVAGPPEEVAAFLRGQGFDASVVDGTVEVRGADQAAVEEALAGRPSGDVPVVLAP
jgi:anti-sigma factor RsiW